MAVIEALADVPYGTLPSQQAIAALNQALRDESVVVRMQALESLEEISLQPGQELLFVALPNHSVTLEDIEQRWPGGQSYIHLNVENNPMYATYRVLTP